MSKRRTRNEALDTLYRVVHTDNNPTVVGQMDIVMADAVQSSVRNDEHVKEVHNQMEKDAKVVTPEKPQDAKVPVKNAFTAKLVLDESVEDFSLKKQDGRGNKVIDDDGMDEYLDYDMFDFIYGLVCDCWPKPLNPVKDVKRRKFMTMGSDNYNSRPWDGVGSQENTDVPEIPAFDQHAQVSSNGNTITVYANADVDKDGNNLGLHAFDWIQKVCELYKFKYSGPNPRRSRSSHWQYSFSIDVPCMSGYPLMVEDYFETLGLEVEDVMDSQFCTQYRKRQAAIEKESQQYINQAEVDRKIQAAITAAAQDNREPLEVHLKRLYADLTAAGLTYQKGKVKKTFMDAFDDDDEEDDE